MGTIEEKALEEDFFNGVMVLDNKNNSSPSDKGYDSCKLCAPCDNGHYTCKLCAPCDNGR